MARFSKNRLFSRLIKQFNEDLTIKTESLETEAQVTTATLTTQVDSAVAQLVSTAPATLDTLDELAAALGDDANFATTVTNALATKIDSAGVLGLIDSAYVSSRVEVGGGGGTLTATAGSALTAGKPVQIKSNGLVEAIQVSTTPLQTNAYQSGTFSNIGIYDDLTVDPFNGSKMIYASQNSDTLRVAIDTGSDVSLYTEDTFVANHNNLSVKYVPDIENKFIVLSQEGTSTYLTVGTVNNTSFTFGTPYAIKTDALGSKNEFKFVPGTSSQIVACIDANFYLIDINYGVGTFSVTDTAILNRTGDISFHLQNVSFDIDPLDPTLIVAGWVIGSPGGTLSMRNQIGSLSSTTIDFSGATFDTGSIGANGDHRGEGTSIVFTGEASGKFIGAFCDGKRWNSNRTGYLVGTITHITDKSTGARTSGSQITIANSGTDSQLNYEITKTNLFVDPYDNTIIAATFHATATSGYSARPRIAFLKVTGNTLSVTNTFDGTYLDNGSYFIPRFAWNPDIEGAFYWTDTSFTNTTSRIVRGNNSIEQSNIRPTDIIGIASATVDSGASADISLVGSVDTNQTGLTPGLDYYVTDDGSLTSTATITNYKIGVAVSSTDLLIQTVSPAYVSYNDLSNKPSIPSIDGLATTTYVDTAVAGIVNSAPDALNTLNELAAALGNDSNFATTVTNQIASKIDSAGVTGLIDSAYVSQRTPASSATVYADSASLPGAPSAGDIAFITNSNGGTFQIYTGTEWHYISLTAPPPPPRLLWRLLPTQHTGGSGLFDLEPSGGTGTGWYNGSTTLTTGLTVANNASLTAGKWGVFNGDANPLTSNASNAYWNAGPSNGTFDPAVGGRTAIDMYTYRWIAFRFSTDVRDVTKILHRTFQAGRPDRIPNSMNLQYYNGHLSDTYDASNWTTYATLTHNMSIGNAKWDNISEGSTVASVLA